MATVNKDFKIKSGLVVEGSSATVGGFNVLTKKQDDQDYIVGLIGGTATSANEANKVVKRDASGNFAAGTITADITGTVSSLSNHDTADLAENASNKYFTNQRALDATSAAYDATGSAAAAQSAAQTFATNADTAVRTAVTTEIGTAKTEAINAASADATSKANAAVSTAAGDATTKANAAVTSANGYTDTAISTEVTNRNSAIASAISTEVSDRNSAISTAVANLVDAAPAALDTLNELAAALNDQVDANGLAVAIGNKLPLAGGTMSGAIAMGTNKITGLGTPTAEQDAATKAYVDAEITSAESAASTAAADALADANTYTDTREGLITTAYQSYADTAEADAKIYADGLNTAEVSARNSAITTAVDALTTSVIEEGSNLYHTDARAKSSAADLLTGATLTNITITGTGSGLTITAENGVADSTTSNLTEGSNLYFTNARAVTALEAVVPDFTAVEINSVAKQVAATLSAPTAGVQTAHAFAKADYRSAEYLVKVANGNHTEISKVLLTLDSTDGIAITEYGIVGTNGSLATVSAGISGANVQLLVTTANNTSTVTVVGTLLA
jgi:hypothetical protein